MKAFYLFLALSLCLASCNSDSGEKDTPAPAASTKPASPSTPAASTQPLNTPAQASGLVEKTETITEAPVDDEGIDYKKLANAACQCGAKVRGTEDSHVGQKHVGQGSTEYQKEVDCFMAAKNKMTTDPISRQKLIREFKNTCPDLPGTMVMRIMMTMGQ